MPGAAAPCAMSGLEMQTESRPVKGKKNDACVVSGTDHSFKITGTKRLFRYTINDELGPLLGTIVRKLIGNPVVYYYRAEAQTSSGKSAMPGILELMSIE